MKTIKMFCSALILFLVACSDDGEGSRNFYYSVQDGENAYVPVAGATVEVYASADAWFNGTPPLKTFTSDANGRVETMDKFTDEAVVYAEKGNYNNWPGFLDDPLEPDPNVPDALSGGGGIFNSFLSLFEDVKDKTYLLTDVKVNGNSIFNSVDVCSKDNFIKLQLNKALILNEGPNVCPGKSATQQFTMGINRSKVEYPASHTVNNTACYAFGITWADAGNVVYISSSFDKVMFTSGTTVTVYTLQ